MVTRSSRPISRRAVLRTITGAAIAGTVGVPARTTLAKTKVKATTLTSYTFQSHPSSIVAPVAGQTEIWFSYTTTAADVDPAYWGPYPPQLWVNTFSQLETTNVPTALTVYGSRNGKLAQIAYSDGKRPYGDRLISDVIFGIEGGVTYYFKVAISGPGHETAEVQLNLSFPPG